MRERKECLKTTFLYRRIIFACLMVVALPLCLYASLKQLSAAVGVVSAVAPIFPGFAGAARAHGTVHVKVDIASDGKVVSAVPVDGSPLFRVAATDAARLWRFAAGGDDDARRSAVLRFDFTLVSEATEAELTPVFRPPYGVEVKYLLPPEINPNERPDVFNPKPNKSLKPTAR